MDSYLGLAQSKVKPRSVVDAFSNRTATIKKRPARPAGYPTSSRPISTSSIAIDTSAQFRYLQEQHELLLEKYKNLQDSHSALQEEHGKVKAENERLQCAYDELQETYNNVTAKNFNAGRFLVYLKLKRRTDKETLEKRNIIKNEACFNTYLQDVVMLEHPRLPKVIHECITALESNDKFMKSPGLYRVSGDHNTIQNLRYDINANNYKRLRKQKSPHEVCGILKLFLRELKDPLISLETCAKYLPDVMDMSVGPVEIFDQLIAFGNTYGKVYKLDFFYDYTIVFSSPEAAEVVFMSIAIINNTGINCPHFFQAILKSTCFSRKSEDYDKVAEWIGDGLLISRGSKHTLRRKAIAHCFNSMSYFVPAFNRRAEALSEKLALRVDRSPEAINIFPELKLHTLGVLCETAMGVEMEGEQQDTQRQARYTQIVEELSSILYWRMFNVFVNFDTLFWLTWTSRRFEELVQMSRNFTHDLIDRGRKKNLLAAQTRAWEDDQEELPYRRRTYALLDQLLETRIEDRPLTDEDIREEVDTFTFAGHDTTASALTFLLYNVARHPDVQEKLYEEIIESIGVECECMKTATLQPESCAECVNTLNQLSYMTMVIQESLRLFPPVPIIARRADCNTTVDAVRIKQGTTVAIDIFSMHRNPEYFPEPLRFNPSRFERSDLDTPSHHRYAYIPFSAGSCNCIGQKFAMYELKSTLVKLIQRFHVRLTKQDYVPPT
uniref:Rho-GAP domain-containing protein n=1 Tax=Anopheles dirus TaxID=7168 RepID=A0A182NA57_9DIPT